MAGKSLGTTRLMKEMLLKQSRILVEMGLVREARELLGGVLTSEWPERGERPSLALVPVRTHQPRVRTH